MCFSAIASFSAATLLGGIGALSLTRVADDRGRWIAAIPLLFALQHALEGAIWLQAGQGAPAAGLVVAFLAFARVLWPAYAPLAVWRAEPSPSRRAVALASLALGVGVAAYLAWGLFAYPQTATAACGHIAYRSGQAVPSWVVGAYAVAVCVPLLAATDIKVRLFGLIVTVGGAISAVAYASGAQSIWCFFAALASASLCLRPAEAKASSPATRLRRAPAQP